MKPIKSMFIAVVLASSAAAANAQTPIPLAKDKGAVNADLKMISSPVTYYNVTPANKMTSSLVGLNVYNVAGDNVGEIEDMVLAGDNKIVGYVIGVGGILGIGESHVVVEPASVKLTPKDGKWEAQMNTTKDILKSAPKFTYKKMNVK